MLKKQDNYVQQQRQAQLQQVVCLAVAFRGEVWSILMLFSHWVFVIQFPF